MNIDDLLRKPVDHYYEMDLAYSKSAQKGDVSVRVVLQGANGFLLTPGQAMELYDWIQREYSNLIEVAKHNHALNPM